MYYVQQSLWRICYELHAVQRYNNKMKRERKNGKNGKNIFSLPTIDWSVLHKWTEGVQLWALGNWKVFFCCEIESHSDTELNELNFAFQMCFECILPCDTFNSISSLKWNFTKSPQASERPSLFWEIRWHLIWKIGEKQFVNDAITLWCCV